MSGYFLSSYRSDWPPALNLLDTHARRSRTRAETPRGPRRAPAPVDVPSQDPSSSASTRRVVAAALEALLAEHNPEGPTEEHLVEALAGTIWRKWRPRSGERAVHLAPQTRREPLSRDGERGADSWFGKVEIDSIDGCCPRHQRANRRGPSDVNRHSIKRPPSALK